MVNMLPYADNVFDIFRNAVMSKRNAALRHRLNNIQPVIQQCFVNYDGHFQANTLPQLASHAVGVANRADLESLYSYKSAIIRKVKIISEILR